MTVALCCSALARAKAERYTLENGISPDGCLTVVSVHEWRGKKEFLGYEVRTRERGRVLLTLTSSYNDPGNPFDINHTTDATAAWNSSSTVVAIDEVPHRFTGRLFVVRVGAHSAQELDIPEKEMLASTKQPWKLHSIHDPEWLSSHRLRVIVHGYLDGNRSIYRDYDVDLRLSRRDRLVATSARENEYSLMRRAPIETPYQDNLQDPPPAKGQ